MRNMTQLAESDSASNLSVPVWWGFDDRALHSAG